MDEQKGAIEKIAEEVHASLPVTNLPLPIKIIALLLSVGGLSISASVLTDIVNPERVSLGYHFLRLCTGASMIAISYGIIRRMRWGLWLYGLFVLIGIIVNPVFIILPLAILVYLYTKRHLFKKSYMDEYLEEAYAYGKDLYMRMTSKKKDPIV